MSYDIVNESTTAYLTVKFTDKTGEPAAPSSISYRIDCLTNNEEVRDDTVVTPPAAEIEIKLTPDDNAIINPDNGLERRCVTIKATYGEEGDEINEEYIYNVKNLRKVGAAG